MGLLGGKKSKQIVGLDIGSSSIKAVELKATKAGYELVSFGMESLAPDTVVDGAIMDAPQVANAISKIYDDERSKTKNVATPDILLMALATCGASMIAPTKIGRAHV